MSYFRYVGKLFSNVKGFYQEINAATLTGAIDTIIIEQEDGSYKSSPFHVRFGKLGVLRSKEKVVDIEVNGEPVDIQMKLGDSGEAFFVEQYEAETEEEELPDYLATSPLPNSEELMTEGLKELHRQAALQISEQAALQQSDQIIQPSEQVAQQQSDQAPQQDIVMDTMVNTQMFTADVKVETDNTNIISAEIKVSREHLDSVQSHASTVKSEHSRDADIEIKVEDETNDNSKNRRKKRRKRKKQKPDALNNVAVNPPGVAAVVLPADDDIFEMDDVTSDEELCQLTSSMATASIPKSISLPGVQESSLERTHEWASAHEGFQYLHNHPFSDTDLSPLASPIHSRPHSPKSDTEVDRQRSMEQEAGCLISEDDDTMWEWGDIPRKSSIDETANTSVGQLGPQGRDDEKVKSSGGLFHFMRKTKNVRHKPEAEGIYLDDLNLNDMDEETAKLYFPKRFSGTRFRSIEEKDEDVESGRGASLPQSPHSVEGAVGGPASSVLISEIKHLGTYSISLCGGLADPEPMTLERFMSKIVTYDDLAENPTMLTSPNMVVRIENNYYNWSTAAPMILAQVAFQKPLPEKTVQSLTNQHMPKKKEKSKKKSGSYSWFSWRRTGEEEEPPQEVFPPTSTICPTTIVTSDSEGKPVNAEAELSINITTVESVTSCQTSSTESPRPLKMTDRLTVHQDRDHSSSEGDTEGSERIVDKKKKRLVKKKFFKKTLRLNSDQIKQLNLKPGQNEVVYSVTTQYQGTKRCHSHIYLWKHSDKIIVSDIDGTITKSDVLGQILPVMGRDWSQSGVAQLYSRISSNGYKFLYLSARAIGQSKLTKDLLQNIKQGKMTLPEGPLLLSPTSLISAFHREVIEKKPEEFKISCLKDIGDLFSVNPFYAGFGNKVNDVYAYKAINIPIFRIFTINPYGELKHELSHTFQSTYTKMTDVADHFFPPLHKPTYRCSEFNQVQYWRDPLPEISPFDVDDVLLSSETAAPVVVVPAMEVKEPPS